MAEEIYPGAYELSKTVKCCLDGRQATISSDSQRQPGQITKR